jgi:hypothetical protein
LIESVPQTVHVAVGLKVATRARAQRLIHGVAEDEGTVANRHHGVRFGDERSVQGYDHDS